MNSFKNSENMNDKEMGFWCGFSIENSSNDKKYAMILYLGTGLLSYYNSTSIYRITTIISDYRNPGCLLSLCVSSVSLYKDVTVLY